MSFWNFLGGFFIFNAICDLFSSKPKETYKQRRQPPRQDFNEYDYDREDYIDYDPHDSYPYDSDDSYSYDDYDYHSDGGFDDIDEIQDDYDDFDDY